MNLELLAYTLALLAVFVGYWFLCKTVWKMISQVNELTIDIGVTMSLLQHISGQITRQTKTVENLIKQVTAMEVEMNRDHRLIKSRQAKEKNRTLEVVESIREEK